jgi:glycosyltransferase involved in cell wall biosynthesis
MRILITGPSLDDLGGVSGYYNAVLPHMRLNADFDIHYFEVGSTGKAGGALHPLFDQIRFRRILNRLRPDIVHCNPSLVFKSYLRDGVFVRHAKMLGYPTIVFFRGWDKRFEERVEGSLLWFFNSTYRQADAFIVLASAFRNKLASWGVTAPIATGTTTVSMDLLRDFSFAEKWLGPPGDRPVRILFLARLEREKGVLETLQALSLLRGAGLRVELTIAGDGAAMADVRRYASDHPELDSALTIAGDVRGDRKKLILSTHDIYCFPSSYAEGMPNSVLEAMAFGLPVVSTPVGALGDFFEDGMMGRLVNPVTAEGIASAIGLLASDRTAMRKISEYNHRYAVEHFAAPVAAAGLLDIYRRTAARST